MDSRWGGWHIYAKDVYGQMTSRLPCFTIEMEPKYDLPSGGEAATLTVGLASWMDLEGAYVETTCTLLPATVEYDVLIQHGIVQLLPGKNQGRLVRLSNNTRAIDQSAAGAKTIQLDTMDALTVDAGITVKTNTSVVLSSGAPGSYYLFDAQTMTSQTVKAVSNTLKPAAGDGNLFFVDPTPDIMLTFNTIIFRAGVMASNWENVRNQVDYLNTTEHLFDPGVSIQQSVLAEQEHTQNVFRSDLNWYAGAAVVQLATILVILVSTIGSRLSYSEHPANTSPSTAHVLWLVELGL